MVLVLLTRPEQAGLRFAAALEAEIDGIKICHAPLQEIVSVKSRPPEVPPAGLILTSERAVRAAKPWIDRPAYVVGTRTEDAVRALGGHVTLSSADGRGLVAQMTGENQPFWHVRGKHVAVPMAEILADAGIICHDWVVYDQTQRPLSNAAKIALKSPEPIVLPLFSPRSARLAMAEIEAMVPCSPITVVGMSQAILEDCRGYPSEVAARPDGKAMLSAVIDVVERVRLLEGKGSVA